MVVQVLSKSQPAYESSRIQVAIVSRICFTDPSNLTLFEGGRFPYNIPFRPTNSTRRGAQHSNRRQKPRHLCTPGYIRRNCCGPLSCATLSTFACIIYHFLLSACDISLIASPGRIHTRLQNANTSHDADAFDINSHFCSFGKHTQLEANWTKRANKQLFLTLNCQLVILL